MPTKTKRRKVNLNLVGLDGNAFSLLGAFQSRAEREGWTADEINVVVDEATSRNYDHLLRTLMDHCEPTDDDE